jgi:hypothetical protein
VQIGYWGYLLTAVAMVPLAIALRHFALGKGVHGPLVDTMTAMGIAAAVLKTLGIVRWLAAMPSLASLHADAVDPAVRVAVEVSYVALNGYAGAVGELLGVQLFSGFWLILLGIILVRAGLRLNGLLAVSLGIGFALRDCLKTRCGESDGCDFENRSAADVMSVSTGSAEFAARWPPQ